MSLKCTDLIEVDLDKLGTTVTDWNKMVDGLKTAAENARKGMKAKSDSARWAGANATVTRDFIAKTAKEISDLHTEANSIYQVLDDGHTELASLQKQIKKALHEDASNLGIRVEDLGDGKVRCYFIHVRGDSDERTQEQLDAKQELENRINGILDHAGEVDAAVARALAKSHGNDLYNAGHGKYESLDDAEAERALELAHKGTKMTDKEFAEFNRITKYNSGDPEFTTKFYKGLGGPKETLEFYGKMSLDGTDGDDKARLALTRELQRNLGTALATATDPDNRVHLPSSWGTDFRKLGNKEIELYRGAMNQPYGYQILGGLLRYGNYDSRFILPIAEHIVQTHHKDPDRFMLNKPLSRDDLDYGFNPSGKVGAGYDPLTSVLEGLGHSPEAAEKFFSDSYTPFVYNEDGTVNKDKPLGYTYFDELTKKDFKWPADSLEAPGEDAAKRAVGYPQDALGHALEAATTGLPYGSDAVSPPHSKDAAALFHRIVEYYGTNPSYLDESPMSDSLGNITADYMRDVQGAFMGDGGAVAGSHGVSAHLGNLDVKTNPEGLSPGILKNFLAEVGKDPDAYGAIINSQQTVTTDLVNEAFHDADKYKELAPEVANRVHPGGEIAGIMAESRTQAVYDQKIAKDGEFNDGVATADKWAGRIIGMGIGKIPVGGEVAGWVVEDIRESVVEHYTHDSSEKAHQERDTFLESQRMSSADAIYDSTYTAATEAGYNDTNARSQAEAARRQILESYGMGRQRAGN